MTNNKLKVLVAPNSFKECADSTEIGILIRTSFMKYIPESLKPKIEFVYRPIADGGDGFLEVCKNFFGLETLHFEVSRPYDNEKILVPTGYSPHTKTLYVESAEVLGLKTIPKEFRNPLILSSKGLGDLLLKIYEGVTDGFLEVEKVIVGIGGTGTNDLGLGMMETFGLELYNKDNKKLDVIPVNFSSVQKIIVPEIKLPFELEMICDVENPLLGELGANEIFAPQKGATISDVGELEKGFKNILKELEIEEEVISKLNGSGGGIAAAMKLFFNAKENYATEFIKNKLKINAENSNYDLVITGEGKYDEQSLLKKGAMIIAMDFAEHEIPVQFICGETEGDLPDNDKIHVIELSEFFNTVEESFEKIDEGVDIAVRRISKNIIQLLGKKNSE
jgi:glycerate kinase